MLPLNHTTSHFLLFLLLSKLEITKKATVLRATVRAKKQVLLNRCVLHLLKVIYHTHNVGLSFMVLVFVLDMTFVVVVVLI